MNSLYTLALRQSTSLQADLTALEAAYATGTAGETASLNGQINASLAALDRTTDDYESLAKREIVETKKEKAVTRVQRFRQDFISLRKQYEKIKQAGSAQRATAERSALLSSSTAFASSSSATSRLQTRHPSTSSPYNHQSDPGSPFSINMSQTPSGSGSAAPRYTLNNPNGIGNDFGASMHNNARTRAALGEHDFMQSTGSTLDGYIALGQATMMNLGNQRDMLKGTQRRLLSAANTLGLSRNTIQYIERRTKADFYILLIGGVFTLFCFYLILKYFG